MPPALVRPLTMGVALLLLAGGVDRVRAQGDSAGAAIPGLGARVTRLRFFEGGKATPSLRDRQYATRFDSATARSIYVEIGLAYPPAKAPVALKIDCGITAPGGTAAGTAVVPVEADAGWELSVHAGGTGADTPGGWVAGAYQVACRYGGKVIASGGFDIARPAPPPVVAAAPPPKPAVKPDTKPAGKGAPKAAPPKPDAGAAATLGSAPFGGLKAKVTAIRFFESGPRVPDPRDRVVTTRFDALTTRFINVELELEYPKAAKKTAFEVECRFSGADTASRAVTVKGSVDPGWVGSYHTAGLGAPPGGGWTEGKYDVTCREEGTVVAATAIEIFRPAAAVASLGASLLKFRIFQSAAERVPNEPRRYGSRFDVRTLKWLKGELVFVYPALQAPAPLSVECAWRFPDGTERPVKIERQIPAGWTGSVHVQGLGGDENGRWPTGSYRVGCRSDGKEFASATFDVVDGSIPAMPIPGGAMRFFAWHDGAVNGPAAEFAGADLDSLLVEASVPSRAAGDSTNFACTLSDPAGITSSFTIRGEAKDRNVTGRGVAAGAEGMKLRGNYRAECRIGTRGGALADRLTITGPADLPSLDARVISSGLYEAGDLPPDDEAAPGLSFSAAKVRSLWVTAILDRPTPSAATFTWQCKVTNARNAVIATWAAEPVTIGAGDGEVVVRQRVATVQKQKWIPGKHTMTCAAGPTTLLTIPFEIAR